MSKKFSAAQQNYRTHEHETIAILEALIKWEDKLLGQKFVVVTDHKSLEYFKTQLHLSSCQTRWWEYISCFNFTIQHVDGNTNCVAVLRADSGTGRVDSGSDRDPARGRTRLQRRGPLR